MNICEEDVKELVEQFKNKTVSSSGTNPTKDYLYFFYNNFLNSDDLDIFNLMMSRQVILQKIIDKNLPGSFTEIGIMKGTFTFQIIKTLLLNGINKNFYIFDFFDQDITMENKSDISQIDDMYLRTNYKRKNEKKFLEASEKIGFKNLKCIQGNIEKSIPEFIEKNNDMFCFIYIDVDVKNPTFIAVKNLWDRLVKGGIMIIDDYNSCKWGPFIDVDNFFKDKNVKITNLSNSVKEGICFEKL